MKSIQQKKPPYSHDVQTCISKIIKELRKYDNSITDIEFHHSTIQRFGASPVRYKTGQPVSVYKKTKTGRDVKQKTFVSHEFCPFCGKKF